VKGPRTLSIARTAIGAFLCGGGHPDEASFYRVIGIGHPIDDDPTLAEVLDLDVDEEAERAVVGGPWSRTRL
jgi:hypothetical protein